jgi:hypothetical protein
MRTTQNRAARPVVTHSSPNDKIVSIGVGALSAATIVAG